MLGSVGARREELRASVDLQQQFERLLHGLEVLVTLGSERLSQRPGLELHTRTELQDCLSTHSVSAHHSDPPLCTDPIKCD